MYMFQSLVLNMINIKVLIFIALYPNLFAIQNNQIDWYNFCYLSIYLFFFKLF